MRFTVLVLAALLAGCLSPAAPADLGRATLEGGWASPVAQPTTTIAANPYWDFEADAAADPTDPLHIAVLYTEVPGPAVTGSTITSPVLPGMFYLTLASSQDGGATWQRSIVPHTGEASLGSAWALLCIHGDPIVFFDLQGLLHIVGLGITCGGPLYTGGEVVFHATTSDDGATWSEPDIVWVAAGGIAALFHDREWAAYDPATGRIGVVWTKFEAALQRTTLTASFSGDGGRTWSLPEEVESALLLVDGRNWLVHALWGSDGKFHVTGQGDAAGAALVHWAGAPGGPWMRSDLPLAACEGATGGRLGYATSAEAADQRTLFVAADVHTAAGPAGPAGVCVFASADQGATWGPGLWMPKADHPWLVPGPEGTAALAHLVVAEGGVVTPTLSLLDPTTLETLASLAMGEPYDADPEDDGSLLYGHYDGVAAAGGRFVWALTRPGAEDPEQPDIWGYSAALGTG